MVPSEFLENFQKQWNKMLNSNQENLLEDVSLYFSEDEFLKKCAYKKTVEKARGKIEKREYWQTDDISWLSQKKEWADERRSS